MIFTAATKYQHLVVTVPGTLIENGKPIMVHGLVFHGVTPTGTNAQFVGYVNNDFANGKIFDQYVNDSASVQSYQQCGPFLADKGLTLIACLPFTELTDTPEASFVEVTIFYSLIGG